MPTAEAPLAAERKVLDTDKRGVDDEKPQLSARRAPPQEKPKKKLTPLEARRARIEQQKQQEVGDFSAAATIVLLHPSFASKPPRRFERHRGAVRRHTRSLIARPIHAVYLK